MTKKAKFPPWTTKKVPFCQMGSVRKDANLCKLPLHPLHANFNSFFLVGFSSMGITERAPTEAS